MSSVDSFMVEQRLREIVKGTTNGTWQWIARHNRGPRSMRHAPTQVV